MLARKMIAGIIMKTGGKRYLLSLFVSLVVFCLLSFLINPHLVSAASPFPDFYYYNSNKIPLNVSTEMIAIRFDETVSKQAKQDIISGEAILKDISKEKVPPGLTLMNVKEGLDGKSIKQTVDRLNKKSGIKYSVPVFEYQNATLILTDEFVVRFKPAIIEEDIQLLNNENGVSIVSRSPYRHNRYVLRINNPKDRNALEIANIYNENPQVEYAEPSFINSRIFGSTYPNDNYFNYSERQQWYLDNIGQDPPGGTPDADMDAPEGWDISTGNPDIVIAIIDTGVDIEHEDLASKIWVNTNEAAGDKNGDGLPGVAGVDDDGDGKIDEDSQGREPEDPEYSNDLVNDDDDENGYVDDFYGWNFLYGINNPRENTRDIFVGSAHGTPCAGLAAAETNNDKGISGVCSWAKIMPLASPLNYSDLAEAIDYAAANGADILNCSWGGPNPSGDVESAIINATTNGRNGKGCVIVCCVGNYNTSVLFPARLDKVIAVGATDHHDERWFVGPAAASNSGPQLDVVAPTGWGETCGVNCGVIHWSTDISGGEGMNNGNLSQGDAAGNYTKWFGCTSAATPQVAGLAGLILSVNPNLTYVQVQEIIESTADDKGYPGKDDFYGFGRINVYKALVEAGKQADKQAIRIDMVDNATSPVLPGYDITYTISYANTVRGPSGSNFPFDDLTNVKIVYYLPAEVDYTNPSDPRYDSLSRSYTWNIGTVATDAIGSVMLTVRVNELAKPLGTITNTCVIEADQIRPTRAAEFTNVGLWKPNVIYVRSDAPPWPNNGMSWKSAYMELQDALNAARINGCDEIWVAAGTYYTHYNPSLSIDISFELVDGVALYGGFAGTETSRSQRNWLTNQTILDGDVDNCGASETTYLVRAVGAGLTTIIDGFTITNGITGNILVDNSSLTIQNNKITNTRYGVECKNGSFVDITNCEMQNNSGQGINCRDSDFAISKSIIEGNGGDGIYGNNSSSAVVENSIIRNNMGYGIICSDSDSVISKSIIEGNGSDGIYNGILNKESSSAIVANNIIRNNGGNGIAYVDKLSSGRCIDAEIKNSWICNNNWDGIYLSGVGSCQAKIKNNTISYNIWNGIASYINNHNYNPNITNCIIWGNTGEAQLYAMSSPFHNVTYSCIQNGFGGVGNIDDDPSFIDAGIGKYHLNTNSPCVNTGDPGFIPAPDETDIDGEPRVNDGRLEMGADEAWGCLFNNASNAPEYSAWAAWGKPDCWCYQRQCRGDSNGKKTLGKWVTVADLNLLQSSFNKTDTQLKGIVLDGVPGICADLDHKATLSRRVAAPDLSIIKSYFGKATTSVPCCDENADCVLGPNDSDYNFWTLPPL